MSWSERAESATPNTGELTVVQAQPTRVRRGRLIVMVVGFLAVDVLVGYIVEWWVGVVAAVGTLSFLPFVNRSATRRTAGSADRIEVRADRITSVVSGRGDASEIRRTDGDVLEVRDLNGEPHVYVVGPGGDNGSIGLGRFDVEEVGRAALAHGWPWRPPGASVTLPPQTQRDSGPEEFPTRQETEIMLRHGRARTVPPKAAIAMFGCLMFAVLVGVALLATLIESRTDLPDWVPTIVMVAGALFILAVLGGSIFLLLRTSRCTISIDREQVSVKYGSLSASVVRRNAVVSGQVGRRWVRLRNGAGKQLMWVPLRPKRDEVLIALRSYGWPADHDTGS